MIWTRRISKSRGLLAVDFLREMTVKKSVFNIKLVNGPIIRYQFPLKKVMEHFPIKRNKSPFGSIIRTSYELDASLLKNT